MRKLKKISAMLCLVFMLTLMFSMTAFASETDTSSGESTPTQTSTGDAIEDILVDGRFQGALDSISVVTEFIDIWFIRIISLVSFFIISAALLKNVCAGAYVANSKFWDKVADAHQKTEAISLASVKGYFQGGQGVMNTNAGSIKDFFLGIIPNIKAFTDFDDADIEPKAYFMKAIPQMLACVIIGIFIYNGYYRDTAVTVGTMGSVIIERTLGSVNPESFINTIFNTTSWPDFPWDAKESVEAEVKLAIANELKSLVIGNFSDVSSSEQKVTVMQNIVSEINNTVNEDSVWTHGEEGMTYKISGLKGYASADDGSDAQGAISSSANSNDVTYRYKFNLHTIVGNTTKDTSDNMFAYITFTMKEEVSKDAKEASSNASTEFSETQTEEVINKITPAAWSVVGEGKSIGDYFSFTSSTEATLNKELKINVSAFGVEKLSGGSSSTVTAIAGFTKPKLNSDRTVLTLPAGRYQVINSVIQIGNFETKGKGQSQVTLTLVQQ